MNNAELDAIEARAKKATPGPWEWTHHPHDGDEPTFATSLDTTDDKGILFHNAWWGINLANNKFIAHAREDIPALVAEVRLYKQAEQAWARDGLAPAERAKLP